MDYLKKSFGFCATNCYIVKTSFGELIIDPGEKSSSWVKQNCQNPLAILNTHGHFDHVFDDFVLQKDLKIPIYINDFDAFLLQNDPFYILTNFCKADFLIKPNETIKIANLDIKFHHFAGHTPGSSMIEIENLLFSGDFLFKDNIGRCDFEFSNPKDMLESLKKIKTWTKDFELLPGHGENSTLQKEIKNLDFWMKNF